MLVKPHALRPSPASSPLLGFLAQLRVGARYAVFPLGAYTRACLEDMPPDCRIEDDDGFLGFIDDSPIADEFLGKPVRTLADAAQSWQPDAIIVTRDTAQSILMERIARHREKGMLNDTEILTHPAPSVEAMAAHLGSYHPTCNYAPEFVRVCQSVDERFPHHSGSTLLCTMDAEAFPNADADTIALYSKVMKELCAVFRDSGFSFSLCVQLDDSPGFTKRTPPAVVESVLELLGQDCVELHGIDHSMPVEGYAAEWLQRGLAELERRFGVRSRYWAPPGWTLAWRTLRALEQLPQIAAVRGFWTGVNCRQRDVVQTMRFPYRAGTLWQIPYSYVDWMFMDLWSNPLDTSNLLEQHERLARFASARPCLFETIAHPYRFIGGDWHERLEIVRQSLAVYARHGVQIQSVARGWLDPMKVVV